MTQEITTKDLERTKNQIFFILGTSRSGSTLLQRMLSSHSELVIPPETHFFHSYRHISEEYEAAQNKTDFREKLLDFWYTNKTRIRDLNLQKQVVEQTAKTLELTDPLDLFTLHLTLYRLNRGKSIVGEKTPRHMMHIPEILDAYPEAKIISLFRDPRAKAYSEIKAQFGSPSVIVATNRWHKYVQIHQKMKNHLPENQYMMIRYCDFIHDVEGVLNKICTFLGVSYDEQMLNYHQRDEKGFAEGEFSWKKQTLMPVNKNNNDAWKLGLTDWQILLIEDRAGINLRAMDYQYWNRATLTIPKKIFWTAVDYARSLKSELFGSRKEGYADPNKFTY